MAKLLFKNPVFHQGRNLTVRRGVKWDVADHQNVQIAATENPDETLFVVDIQTKVMRCEDILTDDLRYEHDPECRTWEALCVVMDSIYEDFWETEIVTLVWFTVGADDQTADGNAELSFDMRVSPSTQDVVGDPRGGDPNFGGPREQM